MASATLRAVTTPTTPAPRSPIFRSLSGYRRAWLRPDLVAGVTLAAVLVPQGIAYAEIAGMPPLTGLYATVLPLVVFAILGDNRHLVLGPDTSTSALVFAILSPLAVAGSAEYVGLATALAVLAGVLLLAGRVLRLGFLSDFLAAPVIVGYQTGLGLQILVGQVPETLGITVDGDGFVDDLRGLADGLGDVQLAPALVGISTLVVILVTRRTVPWFPGVLLAVGGATFVVWAFGLEDAGVTVLGELPAGLPDIGLPQVDGGQIGALVAGAASVALVSFTDTVVEGRTFATMGDYDTDIDRDMIGIGAADIASGAFGAFPISASGSRTAVMTAAGGRSQLANVAAAAGVVLAVALARPAIEMIPNPALGAVVMSAGLALIDLPALRRLWRLRKTEFLVGLVTLLSVLLIGLLQAVGIAVVLSVVDFVRRGARPADAVLARVPGRTGYHTLSRNEDLAETDDGVVVYRFEAPLFFANAEEFRDRVMHLVRHSDHPVHCIVLDGSSITDVDTTAASAIDRLIDSLTSDGVELAVADPVAPVKDALDRYGLTARLAGGRFYESIELAVDAHRHPTTGT